VGGRVDEEGGVVEVRRASYWYLFIRVYFYPLSMNSIDFNM
jgi:hypothetical protein